MQIRPVTKEDVHQLTRLMIDYVIGHYHQDGIEAPQVQAHILHLLENPSEGVQFVADMDGTIAGFATLYFSYSTLRLKRIVILNDLFVDERVRGQHVGEALFQHVRQYAEAGDFAFLQWETTKENHVAQRLYEKMGGELSDLLVYEIRFSGEPLK